MKERRTKWYVLIVSLITIIALGATLTVKNSKKQTASIMDAETLRTMQYEQFDEATYDQIDNCEYVKFGAFFTSDINDDGIAEKVKGTCKDISDRSTYWDTHPLYMNLSVSTKGYLKDGVITIDGNNFNLSTSLIGSTYKRNYVSNDTKRIELNNITAGTSELITGTILANIKNTNSYNAMNTIKLTGIYVDENNNETQIEKTVNLEVDWYGEASAYLDGGYTIHKFIDYNFEDNEEGDASISFYFDMKETYQELIVQKNVIEIDVPSLFGTYPTEVSVNKAYTYDEENHKIHIDIATSSRKNSYTVRLTYPKSAYKQLYTGYSLDIPISGYIMCYNNPNEEFENPYITGVKHAKAGVTFITGESVEPDYLFTVDILGKKYISRLNNYVISKQPILNAYNTDEKIENMNYSVLWTASKTGRSSEDLEDVQFTLTDKVEENKYGDKFNGDVMSEYIDITGIRFSNYDKFIDENGYVKIYNNDTNKLIHTFTYEEINSETYYNLADYDLEEPVKHIRAESSTMSKVSGSRLYMYITKSINVEELVKNVDYETMENYSALTTSFTWNFTGTEAKSDYLSSCALVSDKSDFKVGLEKGIITPTEKLENEKIKITAIPASTNGDAGWVNGVFLVKLPGNLINAKINEVTVDSENVKISGYDIYQEKGNYFIKVVTKNDTPQGYTISIDLDLTPNPTITTSSMRYDVYGYNEFCKLYYDSVADKYDVNGNDNLVENVGHNYGIWGVNAPNSFVALETVSNYNEDNDVACAPNVAEITKDVRTADVNIILINYNTNTVSDVSILGKTPFIGNKNGDINLNSQYTASMSSQGISVPNEISDKVTIYYSDKEEPTKDIALASNNWKLGSQITDFSNIKSYLIIFDENLEISKGKTYEFTYTVSVPEGLESNKVTYGCHEGTYCFNTVNGKLNLNLSSNVVGIRVARFYNLEVMKYKEGTTHGVQGAQFFLYEKLEDDSLDSRRIITSNNGLLKLKNLRANQKYVLQEFQAPTSYELDDKQIEFIVNETAQGELVIQVLSEATFDSTPTITQNEDGRDVLSATIYNTPKYALNILKTDAETGNIMPGVVFSVNGKNYVTKIDGTARIAGLSIGTEYTLTEQRKRGYYDLGEVTFKLEKNADNELVFTSSSSAITVTSYNLDGVNYSDDDLVNIDVNIENEKVPTYNLQILKVDETDETEQGLANAKFILKRIDDENAIYGTTDSSGNLVFENLYQYVEGRSGITGEYILQEQEAPNGYVTDKEEIKFKVAKTAENKLDIQVEDENLCNTYKSGEVLEDGTVKFVIQDKALFKITKKVAGTDTRLPNVEFAIYEVDKETGKIIDYAKDADGNPIGTQNEKEMYVVKTNENGETTAPLRNGLYKMIEVKTPEGYKETDNERIFQVSGNKQLSYEVEEESLDITFTEPTTTEPDREINYIEDLIQLATDVNGGNSLENTKVILKRDLDFTKDDSYRTEDATARATLKESLTDESGDGFTPIGFYDIAHRPSDYTTAFSGVFDGNGKKIENILVKAEANGRGLFGAVHNATIENLTVSGNVCGAIAGGIAGIAIEDTTIYKCHNECALTATGYAGGIIGDVYSPNSGETCTINMIESDNKGTIIGDGRRINR